MAVKGKKHITAYPKNMKHLLQPMECAINGSIEDFKKDPSVNIVFVHEITQKPLWTKASKLGNW